MHNMVLVQGSGTDRLAAASHRRIQADAVPARAATKHAVRSCEKVIR